MIVSAEMMIERDEEMQLVTLRGYFEEFASCNPYERGFHLAGWDSFDYLTQKDIKLDTKEKDIAVSKLYLAAET